MYKKDLCIGKQSDLCNLLFCKAPALLIDLLVSACSHSSPLHIETVRFGGNGVPINGTLSLDRHAK